MFQLIVKYAYKKAWSELAKVVLRFVKVNRLKTNIYIIVGQLAFLEFNVVWNNA